MMNQEEPGKIGDYTWDELYSSLYGGIVSYIRYKFRFSKEEAEDIAQDTFIRAYEKREQFRGPNHPKSWIWTIARNNAINYLRHRKVRGHKINYEENSNSIDELLNVSGTNEDPKHIDDDLPKLTTLAEHIKGRKRRMIFKLHYLQHKTSEEICEQLNMKYAAVKVSLHRAKKDLLEIYKPER